MGGLSQARSRRQQRRRCEEAVRAVPIPDPFDVDVMCQQLAAQRGRPIRVVTAAEAAEHMPCGVWIATATEDVLVVAPDVTEVHREHIILHEVGHMVCSHASSTSDLRALSARLMPHLDPELVRHVLGRTSYTNPQEWEAELFATMLGSRLSSPGAASSSTVPASEPATRTLVRLTRTLGSDGRRG